MPLPRRVNFIGSGNFFGAGVILAPFNAAL
jgi:hypothetical protein